jgi:para-nitrobenzyl esterase
LPATERALEIVTTPAAAVVQTRNGALRGALRSGIYVYKGIPYARGAGGSSRWLPAQPMDSWVGVRTAFAYGPVCPASARESQIDEEDFVFERVEGRPGEDCLRLNLWSPDIRRGTRPVMVWLHGGGYEIGSSSMSRVFDGERLARRGDVVVVSLNHRLGVFGHLDLSEFGDERYATSGNVGILDIVTALEWVRDNIAAFGGDPHCVTIFGQSGGGGKVTTLMAMPAAQRLFHRAIVQSGSHLNPASPDLSRAVAAAVLKALGIERNTLTLLNDVPANTLIAAGNAARAVLPKPMPGGTVWDFLAWQPVLDGKVIPMPGWSVSAPAVSSHVPLLVGATQTDYPPVFGSNSYTNLSEPAARARLSALVGPKAAELWNHLVERNPGISSGECFSVIWSVHLGEQAIIQARRKAMLHAAPAWRYRFDWDSPLLDGHIGATHSAELPFVFDNIDFALGATGGTSESRTLAAHMSDAWIAFARSGDPNHAQLPRWDRVSDTSLHTLLFNTQCTIRDNPDGEYRKLLGFA